MKVDYRSIWKKHYGEIPVDENGITYDIHHIDGDRSNNDISNLQAVSLKEHYEIHLTKGQYSAAHYISQRLHLTKEEREWINNKVSEYNTGRKRPDVSERNKSLIGEKNPMYGKGLVGEKNGMFGKIYGQNPRAKAVIQYDLYGNIVAEYSCIKEAGDKSGVAKIGAKCKGYRRQTGNYIFKFKN
jgi:hypothetical protein